MKNCQMPGESWNVRGWRADPCLMRAAPSTPQVTGDSHEVLWPDDLPVDRLSTPAGGGLGAGMVAPTLTWFALSPLLRSLLDEVRPSAQDRGLQLRLRLSSEVQMQTDPHMLTRILRDVLNNAVELTTQGHVTLELGVQKNRAVLRVHGSGCGLAVEHRGNVFQELFGTSNAAQGFGPGLSIAKRLCDMLAIDLTLISGGGQGRRFVLRLPLAELGGAQSKACQVLSGT